MCYEDIIFKLVIETKKFSLYNVTPDRIVKIMLVCIIQCLNTWRSHDKNNLYFLIGRWSFLRSDVCYRLFCMCFKCKFINNEFFFYELYFYFVLFLIQCIYKIFFLFNVILQNKFSQQLITLRMPVITDKDYFLFQNAQFWMAHFKTWNCLLMNFRKDIFMNIFSYKYFILKTIIICMFQFKTFKIVCNSLTTIK